MSLKTSSIYNMSYHSVFLIKKLSRPKEYRRVHIYSVGTIEYGTSRLCSYYFATLVIQNGGDSSHCWLRFWCGPTFWSRVWNWSEVVFSGDEKRDEARERVWESEWEREREYEREKEWEWFIIGLMKSKEEPKSDVSNAYLMPCYCAGFTTELNLSWA